MERRTFLKVMSAAVLGGPSSSIKMEDRSPCSLVYSRALSSQEIANLCPFPASLLRGLEGCWIPSPPGSNEMLVDITPQLKALYPENALVDQLGRGQDRRMTR